VSETNGTDKETGTWPATDEDGRWRLRWHIPRKKRSGQRISVTVTEMRAYPARFDIDVWVDRELAALHRDVRVGDTLEIAGQLWEVREIDLAAPAEPEAGAPGFRPSMRSSVELQRTERGP
jgi:uncharacterized protein DUF6406